MEISTVLRSSDYQDSINRHVIGAVPAGTTCLDVGCWTGNLGGILINEKKCRVDGVDFVGEVLQAARAKGYGKTYQMNLNAEVLDTSAIEKKYDVIIFADVLEHLVNPPAVLTYFRNFLHDGGQVIISLPNVAFLLNRLQLLLGKWEYRDFGTLDKTHLRFYTFKTGKKMVQEAGYTIVDFQPYNQFGLLRYLDPPPFSALLAYQFLITAKPLSPTQ